MVKEKFIPCRIHGLTSSLYALTGNFWCLLHTVAKQRAIGHLHLKRCLLHLRYTC